jgi:hypothetical protein
MYTYIYVNIYTNIYIYIQTDAVKEVEIKINDMNILSENWDDYNLLDDCNLLETTPERVSTDIERTDIEVTSNQTTGVFNYLYVDSLTYALICIFV